MSKYMAVFTGSPNSPQGQAWQKLDEKTRNERMAAGMKAWHKWHSDHASILVDGGGPLGKTKRVTADGVADTSNAMSGYAIIEAASHEAAAKLFENHPHFSLFPGDGVEIMEVKAIPEM
ncbi:MAG: hypothetical protein QM759_09060 [Terricaulis sp.]